MKLTIRLLLAAAAALAVVFATAPSTQASIIYQFSGACAESAQIPGIDPTLQGCGKFGLSVGSAISGTFSFPDADQGVQFTAGSFSAGTLQPQVTFSLNFGTFSFVETDFVNLLGTTFSPFDPGAAGPFLGIGDPQLGVRLTFSPPFDPNVPGSALFVSSFDSPFNVVVEADDAEGTLAAYATGSWLRISDVPEPPTTILMLTALLAACGFAPLTRRR